MALKIKTIKISKLETIHSLFVIQLKLFLIGFEKCEQVFITVNYQAVKANRIKEIINEYFSI